MKKTGRALIIVDVQPTFCEGGELPVTGGNAVAERIREFVAGYGHNLYDLIVTTQDWHIDPGAHFSPEPDYVDTWPPHGVANTDNADLHPEIEALGIPARHRFLKGEYEASYSGFDGRSSTDGMSLTFHLGMHNIWAVDVVGLAESHCVKATAIDARKCDAVVRVIRELTAPVSEELGIQARAEMLTAGVKQVFLSEVV